MMRKTLVLVLLALYSTAAIGVPLHTHFCAGEFQHVTVFVQKECNSHEDASHQSESPFSCCLNKADAHCGTAEMHGDCCDDQSDYLQIDDDAPVAIQAELDLDAVEAVFKQHLEQNSNQKSSRIQAPWEDIIRDPGDPLYLKHCTLMYYG